MQVLIDTQSSLGVVDYSGCVQFDKQATIVRHLNKPSLCTLPMFIQAGYLPVPQVLARLAVITASGLTLFTGCVSEILALPSRGQAYGQNVGSCAVTAISDDILMDADQIAASMTFLEQTPDLAWRALASLSARPLQVLLPQTSLASSRVFVEKGSTWSEAAGALAAQTGNAYRCITDEVSVGPLGQAVYVVAADDPELRFSSFPISDVRWLARDITIYGREEPTTYVIEVFVGDGGTSTFTLTDQPFHPVEAQIFSLTDLFQGTSLSKSTWNVDDPGAHIALTDAGLTCNGGTGRDGESSVSALQQVELGGTLTLEVTGVSVSPGSSGLMLGLYTGEVSIPNCFAGFQLSSTGQSVTLTPGMSSVSVGSSFTIQAGHIYTLRLRVYSPEMERLRQTYTILNKRSLVSVGGTFVSSSGQLVFEIQDDTSGVAGATTILFSGAVDTLPPACTLGLINSGNLKCSIKTIRCFQGSPIQVSKGFTSTQRSPLSMMTSTEGGSCHVTTAGALHFYPEAIPALNEMIFVSYRAKNIAVARQSLTALPVEALPITALSWMGSIVEPIAWSSNDCDNVAGMILGLVAEGLPVVRGSYSLTSSQEDIWPGDVLAIGLQAGGDSVDAIVQAVTITLSPCMPEECFISLEFATPAASPPSLKLASAIPTGASVPAAPNRGVSTLESLQRLGITSLTSTSLSVNTGIAAPTNGGFEVRRRDSTFGPGVDSDLVLRTNTIDISIPRSTAPEAFYIRMYDNCQPPNYSQFSTALLLNLPLSS